MASSTGANVTHEGPPGGDALDTELLQRWQAGDESAATALVARHSPPLARFIASLGGRDEVDELVQDTFVRAFGALDGFRADSSLRTWLFTIARRLVLDRRRAARRRRDDVEVDESHVVTEGTPLDTLVAAETRQKLAQVMDRLTPTQREVFRLRVGEGLQYREIAEIVGSTEGAARVHYHNAMRAVKEMLDA
jgi:RNA polymerase sigma-70 factor (ECF subfamily)